MLDGVIYGGGGQGWDEGALRHAFKRTCHRVTVGPVGDRGWQRENILELGRFEYDSMGNRCWG